jgi:uncharacterized protein YndB with AHSA1/START domain
MHAHYVPTCRFRRIPFVVGVEGVHDEAEEPMYEEFEVRWEGIMRADPQQVWDAFTVHTAAWIWDISYEPRVGGAERGLTSSGTVTAWDPPRHFQTRAQRPDGWRNELDYTLEPEADGTLLRYVHTGVFSSDYDEQYDQCMQHTAFYNHSMGEYLRHFAARDAEYVSLEAPGSFAGLCRRLGLADAPATGDEVRLEVAGLPTIEGTVDYATPAFLGLRTPDSLIRCFGRDAWGGEVAVTLHLFAPDADPAQAERSWTQWLNAAVATEASA